MRSYILALLLLLTAFRAPAQSTGFGKPILWYTVYDPWAMFIGADGPVFAVYENGQVLYWKDRSYHLITLSKDELEELLTRFRLTDTLFRRSRDFNASSATDQPSYVLRLNLDTLKTFSLYGNMRDKGSQARMPAQLTAVYDLVTSFSDEEATDWLPDKIEVLLSDYNYSPDKPLPWPSGWPDLTSPDTRRREGGASLYLYSRHLGKLRQLIHARKEKQAFLISDKMFYVGYRLPLPGVDSVLMAHRK